MKTYLLILFSYNIFFFLFHKKISHFINLYDVPDKKRKLHKNAIAITGGLLIFTNLLIFSFFYLFFPPNYVFVNNFFIDKNEFIIFLMTCTAIFFLGYLDDKLFISPNKKFIGIICIILPCLFLSENILIEVVRISILDRTINLNSFSLLWTLLCFLLFINAFNMFDGINLQTSFYSIFLIISLMYLGGLETILLFLFFSLVIFSVLNYQSRSFLGDGGTYLLSFIFSYLFIKLYNSKELYSDQIVLLMILPGIELVRLFFIRIAKKRNPFSPDRNHIHHYLIKKFNFKVTIIIIQSLIIVPFLLSIYMGYHIVFIFIVLVIYFLTIYKFN